MRLSLIKRIKEIGILKNEFVIESPLSKDTDFLNSKKPNIDIIK